MTDTDLISVRRSTTWLAAGLIAAAVLLAYGNSLTAAFVYDDGPNIRDNPHITKLWPPREAFSIPLWNSGLTLDGRPLLSLSFALNRALLGAQPWGYRAVNVAIHLCAALTLFGIMRRLIPGSTLPACAAALLWAVHPLHTESVTYIVQRAESLAGLMILLTVYCAIRGNQVDNGGAAAISMSRTRWRVAAVVACLLGTGVKETVAAAPVLVLGIDALFFSGSWGRALLRSKAFYAALFSCLVLIATLVVCTCKSRLTDIQTMSPAAYALAQPGAILRYIQLCIIPTPLVMDYNLRPPCGIAAALPSLISVLGLLALTLHAIRRRHPIAILGLWFFVTLAPSSSIIPSRQCMQIHRAYLASAAVIAAMVWSLFRAAGLGAARLRSRGAPPVAGVLTVFAACALVIVTRASNRNYRTEEALWRHNLRFRPGSYAAQGNLGALLEEQGLHEEAIERYREAVRLNPGYAPAYYNWANVLAAQGDLRAAERRYLEAIRANPFHDMAYNNLGNVLQRSGRLALSCDQYRRALRINPRLARAQYNWGNALARLGLPNEALSHYRRAVDLDPLHADAHLNCGNALVDSGHVDEALDFFRAAMRLSPSDAAPHVSMGRAYSAKHDLVAAVMHFQRALALEPTHAVAHYLLSKALSAQNQPGPAEEHLRRAWLFAEEAGNKALAEVINDERAASTTHADQETR